VDSTLGTWDALSPSAVAAELFGLPCPWWIAGGWAIDLHLGRQTRAHADVDVLFLRADQSAVQRHLAGWDLHAADPPGILRSWVEGETLAMGIHDIWCRRSPSSPWSLQLMIDESEGDQWVYRRDDRIRRLVVDLDGPSSNMEHRVLSPDVQLLYKSADPREKDEADFRGVLADLDTSQRRWLGESLALTSPLHPWLTLL
jgi:Aminoglycoside-2''-adenylyltransferase